MNGNIETVSCVNNHNLEKLPRPSVDVKNFKSCDKVKDLDNLRDLHSGTIYFIGILELFISSGSYIIDVDVVARKLKVNELFLCYSNRILDCRSNKEKLDLVNCFFKEISFIINTLLFKISSHYESGRFRSNERKQFISCFSIL